MRRRGDRTGAPDYAARVDVYVMPPGQCTGVSLPPAPRSRMKINYHRFGRRDDLARSLAESLGKTLEAACDARGEAAFIGAGGSTPVDTYRALGRLDLPWDKVTLTLTDDRWVDSDHPAGNEAMLRRELLRTGAAGARFISLVNETGIPELAEAEIEQRLQTLPRPADVVLAGMGEDGHFASLFPRSRGLERALDPRAGKRCAVIRSDVSVYPRISLTAGMLLQTRKLILLFFGDRKRRTFEDALNGLDVFDKPVRILLNQARVPVDVYWAP